MKRWSEFTKEEQNNTIRTMRKYGGGFVSRLAEAWAFADSSNDERLGVAFVDIAGKYGPGTPIYEADHEVK